MPHPHTVWDVRPNGAFRAWLLSRESHPKHHTSAAALEASISEQVGP